LKNISAQQTKKVQEWTETFEAATKDEKKEFDGWLMPTEHSCNFKWKFLAI
jgi:hypothetical protein